MFITIKTFHSHESLISVILMCLLTKKPFHHRVYCWMLMPQKKGADHLFAFAHSNCWELIAHQEALKRCHKSCIYIITHWGNPQAWLGHPPLRTAD